MGLDCAGGFMGLIGVVCALCMVLMDCLMSFMLVDTAVSLLHNSSSCVDILSSSWSVVLEDAKGTCSRPEYAVETAWSWVLSSLIWSEMSVLLVQVLSVIFESMTEAIWPGRVWNFSRPSSLTRLRKPHYGYA